MADICKNTDITKMKTATIERFLDKYVPIKIQA
jgi:hypothetical protein